MSPNQESLARRLVHPVLDLSPEAASEASIMIRELCAALEVIADHPYGNGGMTGEPEAGVLSGMAKVALERPHGLTHLALEWWEREDESILRKAFESSRQT